MLVERYFGTIHVHYVMNYVSIEENIAQSKQKQDHHKIKRSSYIDLSNYKEYKITYTTFFYKHTLLINGIIPKTKKFFLISVSLILSS